ncbi:MAG TPA: DEAD/DEAH box helicase [Termitinemataceae bacterium]|uniref:DEAD/DEAH box helicase n=1 Tax=Treponema sp. J25 TaxID=2094121 RepID=UPI001048738E|nr:DEAD/DEAH box helicase [Treponema sp. J25]TCW61416.1 cold-shock protein [Treponema sp. J25]HOJ98943.1 DEAD/DEAH box helicase [Termitinemataceae bacterium]HOM23487.1 DEAD/DEAH box helicase [Termitinemataceae bacterium]HPP99998.1 DEAD/DEAH box helicase [Termitinemataceae bacterium]
MTEETVSSFEQFGLSERVLSALRAKGFTTPTSIQVLALPRLLADEGHLIAKARTGTGKTAAFGIPLVERIQGPSPKPRALILTPTRELALQVAKEIRSLAGGPYPRIAAVYGGASLGAQLRELARGVEIVVGTPGRVMDHLERKSLDISAIDWFILDEADEMLDMGFFEDVEKIFSATNPQRRVALFSATMPPEILDVVHRFIGPVEIVEDTRSLEEKPAVDQYYLLVRREDRLEALRRIIDGADEFYGLVFCPTKVETDELARRLVENGYAAEAIHGDLSQEARERTLRRFRSRMTTILVATDVAARGIDIERLTHVINWELPNDTETYVHRIGRTGRAGRRGVAITFGDLKSLGRIKHLSRSMEKTLGSPLRVLPVPSVEAVIQACERRVLARILSLASEETGEPDQVGDVEIFQNKKELQPWGDAGVSEKGTFTEEQNPPYLRMAVPSEGGPWSVTEEEPGSPRMDPLHRLARSLAEKVGPQRALELVLRASFGNELDPSRYGPLVELKDRPFEGRQSRPLQSSGSRRNGSLQGGSTAKKKGRWGEAASDGDHRRFKEGQNLPREKFKSQLHHRFEVLGTAEAGTVSKRGSSYGAGQRIFIGIGRRHGAGARDVAQLLQRAGGVPGRLVDRIEVLETCAYATLPAEAARRAIDFARRSPDHPEIKVAEKSIRAHTDS